MSKKSSFNKTENAKEINACETEIYRSLRTRIKMSNPASKVISVISVSDGDGKTEVASKLAHSMAFAGNKVLLIDFNLRSNDLLNRFKITTNKGLEDLLSGKAEIVDCFAKTDLELLHILPNTKSTEISTEILEMADLPNIIQRLKESYDYVIIDTLSMEEGMDAILLAKVSDGSLFIAVENKTKLLKIEFYSKLLRELHIPILGAILNDVTL